MRFLAVVLTLSVAACGSSAPPPGVCAPGVGPLELTGEVLPAEARTYRMLPFQVHPDTARVELSYQWVEKDGAPVTPLSATTLDLGLWDERGYREQAAFRGWGGSRQGRIDQGDPPIFVQVDSADRGFTPGPVRAGTWHAELGIAAVSPQGADYVVRVQCRAAPVEPLPVADGVDATHVANAAPGWYHGDFHMHAYHSNPAAPDWPEFVSMARDASLDFLMVTEYVTGAHWDTLGAVQRANPDLVIWPGREVITYFGHVNTHGETPGLYDYRHGFEDVGLGWIQDEAKARSALFQVNHPRIFPPPTFSNFCRGCYFELDEAIDWTLVDLIEVVNGPVLATGDDVGAPIPGEAENPFLQPGIDYWEERLAAGFKVTAVSGSDSKGTEPDAAERARRGYGSSATAVYAENLSRTALTAALQAGHAYIRARGVAGSPALEFVAIAPDSSEGMFGDTLVVGPTDAVTLRTTVSGGAGQVLRYLRNGEMFVEVAIPTDPFVHELVVTRATSEGPLGTFWGIETLDAQTRTTIGNPVFLKGS